MPYKDKDKEKIKKREYNKKRYEKNKEKIKQQTKEYNQANKEKIKQQMKEWKKTEAGIKSNTISRWRKFGMVCDDFDSVYEIYVHTWKCSWCLIDIEDTIDKHLDHDHRSGEIRGILCRSCNKRDVLA